MRRRYRWMGMVIAGSLPMAANAQTPFNLTNPTENAAPVQLGGTVALDIIQLRSIGPSVPLRYGNVIAGSETVQLDGRRLMKDVDYAMDYPTGAVILKVAQRAGQTMTVSYRYDKNPAPTTQTASGLAAIGGFRYTIAPQQLNVLMGLGLAERSADGSVRQSNVFGFNNSFKFGQGAVNGVYLYGDRTRQTNQAGLSYDMNGKPGDASTAEGKSQLILQNMSSKFLGGQVEMSYQDVDSTFANFSSAKGAGLDDATLARLQSEKGMTRFGMALKDMRVGSAALSQSYRTIGDDAGGISWRSLGLKQGGLNVNWSNQTVDKDFNRFKDIAEGDREQLLKERGMSRDNRSAELAQKFGKLNYSGSEIVDDATGKKIRRADYALNTNGIKFNLGQQEVDEGFTRFGNLLGDEQGRYGLDAGLHRQWMGLQTAVAGSFATLSFNQSLVGSKTGSFSARDASLAGKGWTLQTSERKTDLQFSRLSSLNDGDKDSHIRAIAQMYGPNVATRAEDRGRFLQSAGIDRGFTRFEFQPFRKWKADFSQLNLKGRSDGGQVVTAGLSTSTSQFSYRKQELGKRFSELTSLMDFERQRLGEIAGLERTDLGMNMALGGKKQLAIAKMSAKTDQGQVNRTSLAFQDKKIDVSLTARSVSTGFSNSAQLVDAEKDLLASMRGFDQRQGKVKWELLPGVKLDASMDDANNPDADQFRRNRHMLVDWTPNGQTQVQYLRDEQKSSDPLSTLFANSIERMSLYKDFGRYGKLKILDERQEFDGTQTSTPDSHKQYLAYETKLDQRTSVRTEQTRTRYDNGDKEDISANTVSTELTKRLGVSVTDMNVDRKGDTRDEKKRNYGFWVDIGNGLLFSYGYARYLTGQDDGTATSTVSLGQAKSFNPDQVGSVQAGQAGNLVVGGAYGANEWDKAERTQAFSNVNLRNAKPFTFGPMTDLKFNFGMDTAADQRKYLRENKIFGLSGKLGANAASFDYKAQVDGTGQHGIDRSYKLQTDPNNKNWLRANVMYKVRTLPNNSQVMVRDYNVTTRLTNNLDLTHQLQTNPEVFKGDAILGSVTQAAKSSKWRLDMKQTPNLTVGGSFEELVNESNKNLTRTSGINMKLFEKSGSPIQLFYGLEQISQPNFKRNTFRYTLQFDQRPGKNQMLSLFLGNVSYERSMADGFRRDNWTMRLDYQIRF